jgi:membrane protein implicated in regulation of membrane protease activity
MAKVVRSNAVEVLRIFAWLAVVAGVIYAVALIGYLPRPLGLIIGIAVLVQMVFFCAFFLVIAAIAENITTVAEDIQDFKKQYLFKGMTQEEIEHVESQRFRTKEEYETWKAKRLPKSDKTS